MSISQLQADLQADAMRCLRDGRIDDGIAAFRAVVAGAPGDGAAWYNLGYLLRCARQYEAALDAYDMAIGTGIDRVEELRLNRAVILSEFLGRERDAEAELRKALAIAPDFVLAWLNLGNLYEDRGDAAAARSAYDGALAVDPGCSRALARIGAIDVFEGQAARAVPMLRKALAASRLPATSTAEIGFALGGALDALGDYDAAFGAYARANDAAAAASDPRLRFDPVGHAALVDQLIALPSAPTATAEPDGASPLFICGMFRSGSTLLEQIMSRHSRITAGGEIDILPAFAAGLRPYPAALATASPATLATLATLRDQYLTEARALHPDAAILTDKRPDNFLHIGLIKRLFPDARILHTVRNPLDTILSVYFLHFDDSISYGHRLADIASWYRQYRRLMAHWDVLYGDDIHHVSYDALVADPRASIQATIDFCGLDWEDALLDTGDANATVRTASAWQVRRPIHRRSSARWRHYAPYLDDVRAILDAPDDQGATAP